MCVLVVFVFRCAQPCPACAVAAKVQFRSASFCCHFEFVVIVVHLVHALGFWDRTARQWVLAGPIATIECVCISSGVDWTKLDETKLDWSWFGLD